MNLIWLSSQNFRSLWLPHTEHPTLKARWTTFFYPIPVLSHVRRRPHVYSIHTPIWGLLSYYFSSEASVSSLYVNSSFTASLCVEKPPPQNISHQSISPLPTPKPIPAELPNIIYEVCVSMGWILVISINRDKVCLHRCAACAPWCSCVRLRGFCLLFESREEGWFCTVPKPHLSCVSNVCLCPSKGPCDVRQFCRRLPPSVKHRSYTPYVYLSPYCPL